ncbi:HET-domain-containing protein [Pyrenochaeta sp. DS3sAY3a]|nr:HET-domain-containing protein [Pyrenochaeta sp. DS3sAY3a]
MLCRACQEIFSSPRTLSCGTYYPWKQTAASFRDAIRAGCHLCNLIEESRSYDKHRDDTFPQDTRYAFKALNPKWARSGRGPKWFVPQTNTQDGDEETERERYLNRFQQDPTPNGLGQHLAMDSEELDREMANSWLVLEFYGGAGQVLLPIELATHGGVEELAQRSLDGQTTTGSQESLQIARAWLHNCLTSHSSCKPLQPEPWLPTRLLDVGSFDKGTMRLVLGASLDMDTQYVALSHRWGTDKTCVLNSTNLTTYQEQILQTDLSATIRDSVVVTRALGLRYLWVDSMCIIQDDSDDWARESATMSKVYGLSTCTIAAANSGSGSSGCFANRNQYRVRPCRVPNPFKTDSKYSFFIRSQYLHNIHDRGVRGSLWYNRGWVFQERTLSPRLLIFCGTQILWACEGMQAAETWPCGKTGENYIDQFKSFAVEKARFRKLLHEDHGVSMDHSSWWDFLQDYIPSAELTNQSDRLIAIQGIATLIASLTGIKYCAGFWVNDHLPGFLLWQRTGSVLPRPTDYHAPSWSWAAVQGTIELVSAHDPSLTNLIQIHGYKTLPGNQLRGGRNIQEALRVTGTLLPAAIFVSFKGDLCERVFTIEYSKRTAARMTNVLRLIWIHTLHWINVKTPALLTKIHGHIKILRERHVMVFMIYYLVIFLGAVAISPVLFLLWLLFFGFLIWECCCPCMVSRLEKRARRKTERKLRRFHILKDLEIGIPMTDLQDKGIPLAELQEAETKRLEEDGRAIIKAACTLDARLPWATIIEVFCLPVVQDQLDTWGLLLRSVEGTTDHYERIGTFKASHQQLRKILHPRRDQPFLLV